MRLERYRLPLSLQLVAALLAGSLWGIFCFSHIHQETLRVIAVIAGTLVVGTLLRYRLRLR
jgi:hypothetical protein